VSPEGKLTVRGLYTREYFRGQISKSDEKVAFQYGRLLKFAGLHPPLGPLLDVGCGAGPGLRFFEKVSVMTVGIDFVEEALHEAASVLVRPRLVLADASQHLPFIDNCFQVVVLADVIEHIVDPLPLLQEVLRVLQPSGRLLLSTVNAWDVRRLYFPLLGRTWSGLADPTHVHLYSPPELGNLLRMAGFGEVRVKASTKPAFWVWSRRLRLRIPVPWPPLVGNGLWATAARPAVP
jgi:SAM-dependent methyltransferase